MSMPECQSDCNEIYVKGFMLNGGKLNLKNYYLEEESSRQFGSYFPNFSMKAEKKAGLQKKSVVNNLKC